MAWRIVWTGVAMVVGFVGTVSSVMLWRLETWLSAAVMSAVVAVVVMVCRSSAGTDSPPRHGGIALRAVLCAGLVVAAGGLCTLLGAAGFAVVVVMAISCPWVLRRTGVLRGGRLRPDTDSGVEKMTTLGLCQAWVATGDQLRSCDSPDARLRLATVRQIYLDELERRDPDGVSAWLGSDSASAAGDPHRFLSR
jgi:4-amino-4-deoxy-L-arabinose transferase-like glycosyltransferase